jgi:hypothetical protein
MINHLPWRKIMTHNPQPPQFKPGRLFWLPVLILIVSLACNLPMARGPSTSQSAIQTAAAETLQAQLTAINQVPATLQPTQAPPTPTLPQVGTITPTVTPPAQPTQQPTVQPSPTPTCNQAKFVKDVTYPDNTDLPPATSFTKTWRLQNTGTCSWNSNYTLVVDGKNTLNAPTSSQLTNGSIAPGATADISVDLISPDIVGTYQTNFLMRSDSGQVFGIGDSNKPFWARIDVIVASGVTLDFNIQASEAKWTSGTGKNVENDLVYPGDLADPNGAVNVEDGVKLENNATSGKVLVTVPKNVDNGFIQGVYPAYTVQPGDHLKGRLGFMLPSGSGGCGDGKIRFEILYRAGDNTTSLGKWDTACDGTLTPIDLDLTALKGKSVKFILVAKSIGAFLDNYAVWNSLGVLH